MHSLFLQVSRLFSPLAFCKRIHIFTGFKFGNPDLEKLNRRRRAEADVFALSLIDTIEEIRAMGSTSVRAIASELNRQGVPTMKESSWYPNSVQRLLRRIQRLQGAELVTTPT